MSKSLSSVAQEEFDTEVKHAYQTMGGIKSTVTNREGVVGSTYNFRKMGKGLANKKSTSEDVTPMNVAHTKPQATLENWNAPEYTDIFDQATVNFDEKRELAQTIAGAIGRRNDQLIIDAIDAQDWSTLAMQVTTAIGGTATNLNTAKLRRASRLLNAKGVPGSDRHILVSAIGIEAMLGTTEVTSGDYNTVRALVNGEINTFVGFNFHVIEDRTEDGLPIAAGDVRSAFAYHSAAVGLATGIGFRTEVNYIAHKTSWLCNGILKAGSVVRDTDGCVEILCDET
jgi:hypothetical protein